MKNEIVTNEWTRADVKKPLRGREVLVAFADGSKRTLVWNNYYWSDPKTKVRQMYHEGAEPKWWYMFEKFEIDGRH